MSLQRSIGTLVTSGLALALLVGSASAQDRGTVTGQVTDAMNGQPLIGAQIVVEGTTIGGLTNESGRFLITSVPVGQRTIRAILLGYGPVAQTVLVTAGETAVLNFSMQTSAIALDEVIVTATGEQRKREIGNAVATLQAAEIISEAPISNVSELIQGRAAGVQVTQSSGQLGMGSRIRIRGASSISLSNDPLVYVDGVRVESSAGSSIPTLGGQDTSRLDDFNPEDIESIEIIKGPAAATLYGTEAANGVIRITTKSGKQGETRWNFWAEAGLVQEKNDYPLNFGGLGVDGGSCLLDAEVAGNCTQSGIESFQVLQDPTYSPIDDGMRQQYGLSVTGGGERINYYVSAEIESEDGPYTLPGPDREDLVNRGVPITESVERPFAIDRVNLRANINAQIAEDATLQFRAGYLSSNLSTAGNDNNSFGFLPSAFFGGSDPNDPDSYWGFQKPAQLFGRDVLQDIERFTGSVGANWNPLQWLTGRATVGLDYTNRHDISFFQRDLGIPGQRNLGWRDSNFRNIYQYTVDASASGNFDLTDQISSKTSVGVQYFRDLFTGTDAQGRDIVTGSKSIGSSAENFASETTAENKTFGIFAEQQIGLNDRVFATVALRADDNSAFGQDFDLIYYPKASISWLLSEEEFFPRLGLLDTFRFRAAWGRSGLQPGSTAAIQTLNAEPITDPSDNTISGVSIGALGNNLLAPEKSSEIEAGFDADLWEGRIGVELTYYNKTTEDALIQVPLAPSLGASTSQWVNIGEVNNSGWEAAITATAFETDNVSLDLGLSGSINSNELVSLGEDQEPIGTQTRFVEGFPLGGQWGNPIQSFGDTDGNGILTTDELVIGDTLEYVGPGLPEQQLSVTGTLRLFDRVRLYALLDHRGDYVSYNNTERFRCRFRLCQALIDRDTPLWDQARAVADVYHPTQTNTGYIEDASFWKLREVSATLTLPEAWASQMRADRASITVTGRNLITWTDYTGMDPEINSAGSNDNFGTGEFLTQPPLRYWTLRVNLGF